MPLSIRSVAAELGVLGRSLRDLISRLDQQQVIRESGSLTPASVKGSAALILSSDGSWTFTGHIHNNGFLKHNYVFAAAPEVVDDEGNVFVFSHKGSVTDSRDDDFDDSGRDIRVSANWDLLRQSSVRFRLEAKPTIDPDLESVVIAMGIVAGVALVGGFIAAFVSLASAPPGAVNRSRDPNTGAYRWEW